MKTNANKTAWNVRLRETLVLGVPLLLYAAVYLLWWGRLEKITRLHYTVIHTRLDDLIPFQEAFIVPYLLWFGYCVFTICYFLFKGEKEDYLRATIFLCTGMTLFLIVSTLFPNALHLRPRVFPRDNALTRMVASLYLRDTSTNVFPSIHVYNAIGCHLAIAASERFSRRFKSASFVLCVSIILSTMFLKQHSVFDVLGAMALAVIMDYVVYRSGLIKLVNLSDELVGADRNHPASFAGEIHKVSETGKAHP